MSDARTPHEILHNVVIRKPPADVYRALTTEDGIRGWWTPDVTMEAKTGGAARFVFVSKERTVTMNFVIEELVQDKHVKWRFVDGLEHFEGTTVSFDLEPHPYGTLLRFAHRDWARSDGDLPFASYHWAAYLRSIKGLLEEGKGTPHPEPIY